ncbi:histone-binding protein N1/N2-like isoform X3 [Sinocyclocheilus rhinocerous]|uniref:histone-binding protein N1/N2-like isoform X3 n=1 Tax=Sinocyclocheilus rhinocerous TaxID=307959 RepID=UPI0007BA96F2|nr:PREDICTED: histone-binding protein N1/N2-like isoform X3 [Sinocyclocheilus rhinocerous]
MPEETAAASTAESMEEKPCSSSAADSSVDVSEEAKKLIGTGNRHLVMGDVVSAVSVFQEACAMLAEKYGDTADECGEAFFLCGKALLELARMENTVLGNALEGVPEESSEEGEKQNDSKIESADNLDEKTRDELRAQVYDAMTEDKTWSEVEKEVGEGEQKNQEEVKEKQEKVEAPKEGDAASQKTEKPAEHKAKPAENEKLAELEAKPAQDEEKQAEHEVKPAENEKQAEHEAKPAQDEEKQAEHEVKPAENEKLAEHEAKPAQDEEKRAEHEVKPAEKDKQAEHEVKPAEKDAEKSEGVDKSGSIKEDVTVSNGVTEKAEKDEKVEEKNEETEEPMEEGGGDDDDDDEDAEGETKDKESEEDEVGNLQLAWEMLEVAKVIYKRKDSTEDQLMAAQIYLKLGEVGAESGNYSQALDDFNECLTLQLKHLPSHSRLLAETHYQLGTTYSYTAQYSQAIEHFSNSIKVIESRLAMLQEVIDKAEGAKEKSELEELKQLLPEITEKIEDAKEGQRTAAAASEAIHQTLAGASTSSAFPAENGSPSSSTASQIPVRPADGASSSKSASDISHLVRKKRKPDEESPKKDSDAKKTKQETSVNGSGDSAHNGNGVQEKMEQEPASSSSVEMSA